MAVSESSSAVRLSFGFRTDVGRKRSVNEDSVLAVPPLFLVADGMGGHEAGDRASEAVVAQFRPLAGRAELTVGEVVAAVDRGHAAVREISVQTTRGAGSTLTGVALVQHDGIPQWLIVNVGDSRVYCMRGTELSQLTIDHSLAQQLVDEGSLDPADVATFAQRNVITRAMGAAGSVADYWLHPVVAGERLLVCSDGLSGELADESLRAGLTLNGGTQQTADILLAQALERGGRDNITLIVIDVVEGGLRSTEEASTSALLDLETATVKVHRSDDTIEVPGRGGRGYAA